MAPKKASNNAFFYFMMEMKDKNPKKYGSMAEVSAAAGQHWEKMTDEQKRPYQLKAKTTKNNQKIIKYTSFGQDIEVVQRKENESLMKNQQMKDHIENIIQLAVESEKLLDEIFYFIHVNFFCYCINEQRYYPAEISVARWTLRDGVKMDNVFSMICKPGGLPLGYTASAMNISRESHQIEPPMSSDTEYNLDLVANSLWKFMTSNNSSGNTKLPPVYAGKKNSPVVENVLLNFSDEFGLPEFKVYSLEHFFFTLRNNCGEKKVFAASSLSQLELEKDKYEFCREIACSYHESSDIPNYCSQSIVIRTVYTICDNCCGDVGIDLIPSQHVPRQANLSVGRSQSRASSIISSTECARSNRHQPLQADYLSRGETDYSELSETSTVVDPNDYNAVGGFDSEYSQDYSEEWIYPKQNKKGSNSVENDNTNSMSSSRTPKQSIRRPATLSAALTGLSQMSISKESRGRGRGIAANFSNIKK